jgi:glycosyltransferase involved in cell wall biosynthesis
MPDQPLDDEPSIAFYTIPWTNLTDKIRQGGEPAGTASVFLIWKQCVKRGLDTHVFVIGPESLEGPANTEELGGVHFHWIKPVAWRLRQAFIGWHLGLLVYWIRLIDWTRLWRATRRQAPDARIFYSMRHTFSLLVYLLAKRNGGISVVRYYGTWLYRAWTTEGLLFRLVTLPNLLTHKIPVDLYITTNDGTRGDVVYTKLGVPEHKRCFWMNGVRKEEMHLPDFDRAAAKQRLGLPPKAPVLMTVGRLADWKRHDRILRALPLLLEEFPETKYVIVGDGPERTSLESLVKQLGVADAVRFLGAIANDKLPEYLNFADIYVQSNDFTNLTTTLIEALGAGCCCVTRAAGGTEDIVDAGQNAVLLKPGETEDFAQSILHLLRNPEEVAAFRRRAYVDAQQRFQTWDERLNMEVDRLLELLQR